MDSDSAVRDAPPPPHHAGGLPYVGGLPALRNGLLDAFMTGWRERGDIVLYNVPRPMVVFAHPDDVQHAFVDHFDHHPRSWLVKERLVDVIGNSIFEHEGATYRRDLRVVAHALAGQSERLERLTLDEIEKLLDSWRPLAATARELDAAEEMQRLNLDVWGRVLFGDDWAPAAERMHAAITRVYDYLVPRVTGFPTPLDRFFPPNRRYRRALAELDSFLYDAIAKRRAEPTDDLVSAVVEARDEESGWAPTDAEVRAQVTSLILGFYKSIGTTLTWTWQLLSANPRVRERLEAELGEVLGGRLPSGDDLPALRYTRMVLDEVLRLYPPLYIIARPPIKPELANGYRIDPKLLCLYLPYITHRHPDAWSNPEGFEPERFEPSRVAERHPCAYFPFAVGPRRCPGEPFAVPQLVLAIAAIAQRYRLDLVPGHTIKRHGAEFLLRPINGLPVRLRETPDATADA